MHPPENDGESGRPMSRREARERGAAGGGPAAGGDSAPTPQAPSVASADGSPAASDADQLKRAYDQMVERGGSPLPRPAADDEAKTSLLQAFDDSRAKTPRDEKGAPVASTKQKKQRKRKHRVWPWIVFPIVALLAGAGVVGGIFVSEALSVRDDLNEAKDKISGVMDAAQSGDLSGLDAVASDVLVLTTRANKTVNGPLWDIATKVPFVGQNVTAVSEATRATHILVEDALPAGMELLAKLDLKNISLADGGFNLQPFRDAQATLPVLNAAFDKAMTHIDRIDREAVLPFVNDSVGQLIDIVQSAGPVLATAEKYLPVLLPMVGDGGPRTYALIFQNNAEIRATGGNAATTAVIRADNGKIEMLEDWEAAQFAAAGIGGWTNGGLPEGAEDLYESDTPVYAQNFTRTPDFPETARLFTNLWQSVTDTPLDGVISIDPVVLSYMLRVTGPVETEDGEINADNAVKLLLSDTYERFGTNGLAADAFFATVAANVFDKVSSGAWDPMAMLEQLTIATKEQRIHMSLPRPEEQAMAVEFGLDGALAADNTTSTQVGVFLNNSSYSKLEYYLSTSMAVTCNAEARTVTTALTMASTVPGDHISRYALGYRNDRLGFSRTTMLLDVLAFALPGGTFAATDPESGDLGGWDRSGTENGREGRSLFIAVPMGESKTVSFTTTVPDGATQPLDVRYTPTVTQTPVTIDASCATMFPGTEIPGQ